MQTEQLIEQMSNEIGVVKPASNPFVLSAKLLAAFALYIAIILPFFGTRPDLVQKLVSPLFLNEIISLVLIIVSACVSAAILSFPDMYQKKNIALLPVLAFLMFAFDLLLEWFAENKNEAMPVHEIECFLCIIGFSIVPVILLFYSIKKNASTHSIHAGCTSLLAAFAVGALILRLAEQTDSISHLLQWHYLPMLGIGLLGMICGKIFLKW